MSVYLPVYGAIDKPTGVRYKIYANIVTTDGSGTADVDTGFSQVVAVFATVTGGTPYIATVDNISGGSFTIRTFDTNGATAGSVSVFVIAIGI